MTDNHTAELTALAGKYVSNGGVSESDFQTLVEAMGTELDLKRLNRFLRRRSLGEPLEYITGFQIFRNRRFEIDKRVYITDPELTHLVDVVVASGRHFAETMGRAPVMVEFGVGCGSLAISVKRELPGARVIGLDLDSDAIAVAWRNARTHHVDLELFESDFFSDLPEEIIPDMIFGDPPWGNSDSLYDGERSASHYHAMPILSAFPDGDIASVHQTLLKEVSSRAWQTELFLNLGVLDQTIVETLTKRTCRHDILAFDNTRILRCKVAAEDFPGAGSSDDGNM